MNAWLFLLLIFVVAVIIFVVKKKTAAPPVTGGGTVDWGKGERRLLLEEIRTVFAGAKTQSERDAYLNSNFDRITEASNYEDFAVEYDKLKRQYNIV